MTQVVDLEHPVLGFFHRWIIEFAKHCEHVHVICLQEGKHDLPANVSVHSLGKEMGKGRLVYLYRFYRLIWSLRREYDKVFVHMNQIYVILGAPVWKLLGKRVGLWYVHKQVSVSLRLAVFFVDAIFSTTKEAFRIVSSKVHFVGHGIDLDAFVVDKKPPENHKFVIAHIGRITKIKKLEVLIEAFTKIKMKESNCELHFYGKPASLADGKYLSDLKKIVIEHSLEQEVFFKGPVNYTEIPNVLSKVNCTVNLAPTGGMDKAVLESAAAGIPVFVANTAFFAFLDNLSGLLGYAHKDSDDLAQKILSLKEMSPTQIDNLGRRLVHKSFQFDISDLIKKIFTKLPD